MTQLPNLNHLSHAEKDALILALWAQVQALTTRTAELEAKLGEPAKTPDNSSLPPSKGQKPNPPEKARRIGPRKGSVGRKSLPPDLIRGAVAGHWPANPMRRSPRSQPPVRIARPR